MQTSQGTIKKIASDKPCEICNKGTKKFIITLKETYKGIDNFDCQVIVIRQCDKCKEVDYDLDYGPEPTKVESNAVRG